MNNELFCLLDKEKDRVFNIRFITLNELKHLFNEW
jgi:hypothetical protein